jgi:hypothetical protein
MGYIVGKVSVYIQLAVEFLGPVSITFDFVPNMNDPVDKQLADALLAKNDALNLAAAKLAGRAQPFDVA